MTDCVSMAEEVPVTLSATPQWVTELVAWTRKSLPKTVYDFSSHKKAAGPDFNCAIPMWAIAVDKPSVANVWPLEGAVRAAAKQYLTDSFPKFPPPGKLLELAVYRLPFEDWDQGQLERENLDIEYLGWLVAFRSVSQNAGKARRFLEASRRVLAHVNLRRNELDKSGYAYQMKEDEDKDAQLKGHSVLTRGRELCSLTLMLGSGSGAAPATDVVKFMQDRNMSFATSESKMTVP